MSNVYSVEQVNRYIKNMFTQDFMLSRISVGGEVSNCKYHSSGHIYFSLKDGSGSLACVMFAGQYSNLEGYGMRSLRLNGEILYRNPYADRDLRLTDEEIAVAQMMEGMKTYVETGKEVYPLEEALQDTYLFLMMDEAAKEGKEIQTQDQCWKKQ